MSQQLNIRVAGMTCQHCVGAVTREVMELPGVTGVSVELATQGPSEVRIESEVDLDAATVAAAITEAGYQMVSSGE